MMQKLPAASAFGAATLDSKALEQVSASSSALILLQRRGALLWQDRTVNPADMRQGAPTSTPEITCKPPLDAPAAIATFFTAPTEKRAFLAPQRTSCPTRAMCSS